MVFCSVFTTWESVDCDHIGRLIKCTAIKNFLLIVLYTYLHRQAILFRLSRNFSNAYGSSST